MGSLTQGPQNLSLAERLKMSKSKPAVLIDRSGSMFEDAEPNVRKIDALKEVLTLIQGPLHIIAFNTRCEVVSRDSVPEPSGGTWLSPALNELKKKGYKEAIVITDGDVNDIDKEKTLAASEGLNLKILYVGPDGKKPAFLDELAKKTGGFCNKEDLAMPKELAGKIQKLLGPGGPSERKFEL